MEAGTHRVNIQSAEQKTGKGDRVYFAITGYLLETQENFRANSFNKSFVDLAGKDATVTLKQNGQYWNVDLADSNEAATPPAHDAPATPPPASDQEAKTPAAQHPATKPQEPAWKTALRTAEGKMLAIGGKEREAKIELGFAVQCFEQNPKLKNCTVESIINSIVNIVRIGTTLNPALRLAYLVPRMDNEAKVMKCTLLVDYKGLVKILKDNNCVKYLDAIIVYADEKFEHSNSPTSPPIHIRNVAKTETDQRKRTPVGIYSRVVMPDGSTIYTDLTPFWEIDKAMKVAQTDKIQKAWPEEMQKKTKIRKDFKLLISGNPTENVVAAMENEDDNDFFSSTAPDNIDELESAITEMRKAGEEGNEVLLKELYHKYERFKGIAEFLNANAEAWQTITDLKSQSHEQPA